MKGFKFNLTLTAGIFSAGLIMVSVISNAISIEWLKWTLAVITGLGAVALWYFLSCWNSKETPKEK